MQELIQRIQNDIFTLGISGKTEWMFWKYTISTRLALLCWPWTIILQFAWWITHFFSFCGTFKSFFSIFDLGSGTTKAVQRKKFMFSWKIRPNPFTSGRMTCGNARVFPSQSCKILAYDDQFRFLYTR